MHVSLAQDKAPGQPRASGNTLLSQLHGESSAASGCSASRDQVEHLWDQQGLPSKRGSMAIGTGLTHSTKGFGAPPRAAFVGNVPNESGRTIPHLTADDTWQKDVMLDSLS